MRGLVLYGPLKGVSLLRGLEDLTRSTFGSLWISGGLCSDHGVIGRFIQLHEESITGEFLTALTRAVLKATGTGVATVAGDGTVVQAAASCYHTIQLEAAQEATREAREAA